MLLQHFLQLLTLPEQAAQLAYMMDNRLKDTAEEVDEERALKDITMVIAKEKATTAENVEARVRGAKEA